MLGSPELADALNLFDNFYFEGISARIENRSLDVLVIAALQMQISFGSVLAYTRKYKGV